MTAFIVQLAVAWILLNFVYLAATAVGLAAFGIECREISFGSGKQLWSWGKVQLRAIPLSGYVKFSDTRHETDDDPVDHATAYDHKPPYVRALVCLTGVAVMVLVATLLLARAGIPEFTAGFRQLIVGAFSPTSTAQQCIRAANDLWIRDGFLALLGVMAAKFAAFNLLPLPFLSGGQAIRGLLPADETDFPRALMNVSIVVWLALIGSWAYAVIYFAIGAEGR